MHMTFKDLKRIVKSVEEDTQTNWDDARIFFRIIPDEPREGRAEATDNKTMFQNAPFRAIIFDY